MLREMERIRPCKINALFCPEQRGPCAQHCATGGWGGRAKLTPVRKIFPERAQTSFASKTRRAFILQAPDPRRPHNRICDRPCPISAFFFPNPVPPGGGVGRRETSLSENEYPLGRKRPCVPWTHEGRFFCKHRTPGGLTTEFATSLARSRPSFFLTLYPRGGCWLVDVGWWVPAARCRLVDAAR